MANPEEVRHDIFLIIITAIFIIFAVGLAVPVALPTTSPIVIP